MAGAIVDRSEMSQRQREYLDAVIRSLGLRRHWLSVEDLCQEMNRRLIQRCDGWPVQIYAFVHEGQLVLDALHVETKSGVRTCPTLPSFP